MMSYCTAIFLHHHGFGQLNCQDQDDCDGGKCYGCFYEQRHELFLVSVCRVCQRLAHINPL